MRMKRHPMWQANVGTVFAVAIAPGKWGYVRFYHGLGMQILSVVGAELQIPKIDWSSPPVGWIFASFAPDADKTEAVRLGVVPFENPEAEWAPPCFVPPSLIDRCYRIHEKAEIRRATQAETRGMRECRRLTPAQLSRFLLERLQAGELHEV